MADAVELMIQLQDKVSKPARDMQRAVDGITKSAERLKRAGGRALSGVTDRIAGIGKAALMAGGALAALGAGAFTKAAVQAAIFGDSAAFAFKTLMKGSGNAAMQLERVQDLAVKLGLPMQDTISSFQELMAAKFTPQGAEDIIKLAADMRAVGASTQKVSAVMLALRQVKSKPVLSFEELNQQLSEAGVASKSVLEQLAKMRGTSVMEIDKLIRTGKISGDEGIEAVKRAVMDTMGIKQLGAAGEQFASTTLEGMIGVFKARTSKMFIGLGQQILPSLRVLFDKFTSFANAILPDVALLFGDIGKAAKDLFGSDAAGKAFGFQIADIKNLIKLVRGAVPVIKSFADGFLEGFTAVQGPAREFLDSFTKAFGGENKSTVQTLATGMRYLGMVVGGVAGAFGAVFVAATRVVGAVTSIIDRIEKLRAALKGLEFPQFNGLPGPGGGVPKSEHPFGLAGEWWQGRGAGIPTSSSLLGAQLASSGGFGEMGEQHINSGNSFSTSISVTTTPSEREIASAVRREVERLLTQKLGSLPV